VTRACAAAAAALISSSFRRWSIRAGLPGIASDGGQLVEDDLQPPGVFVLEDRVDTRQDLEH
jgi:hypothetical protein